MATDGSHEGDVFAFAHGFTSMESAGRSGSGGDVDEAYQLGIETLLRGLAHGATT